MAMIAAQADAEQRAEVKAEQRRVLFRKIRKVVLSLVFVSLVGTAFCYRTEIGHGWEQVAAAIPSSPKIGINPQTNDKLKAIQEAAVKRDRALEELTGGK